MQIGAAMLNDAFRATSSIPDDALAIWRDGADLVGELYLSGFRLDAERGRIALPEADGTATDFSIIHHDTEGAVADGAILWRMVDEDNVGTALAVWDIGAPTPTATGYAPAAGRSVSAPVYMAGWVYWLEVDLAGVAAVFVARLMRSPADLSAPEEVWLVSGPTPDGSDYTRGSVLLPRLSATVIRFVASLFHGETGLELVEIGVELDGDTFAFPSEPVPFAEMRGVGLPVASGCLFAPGATPTVDSAPLLWQEDDSTTAAPDPVWPDPGSAPAWVTNWEAVRSFALNGAKTKALCYGVDPGGPVATALQANALNDGGRVAYPVEEHPTLGFPVAYLPSR